MEAEVVRTGALGWLLQRIENVLVIGGIGAAGLTIAGFGGALWWPFDLAAHFRVQYFVILLVVGLITLLVRRRLLATAMIGLSLVNLATIVPLYRAPAGAVAATGPTCRFMLLNVRTDNTRHDLVADEIRRHDPDVLVLQEVNEEWLEALGDVVGAYPHSVTRTRRDNFGIAVYSRHAMEADVRFLGETPVPTVLARMSVQGTPLTVIATHPLPPGGATRSRIRDRHLAALAELVTDLDAPVVVLGDLNATPWSAPFRALVRESGLRDASRGRGIHATWPTNLPPMLIPIDHCLHTPDVAIVAESVGSNVGSDHFPLIVDGQLGASAMASSP